jgi:SSS family solute:Na+ symporter
VGEMLSRPFVQPPRSIFWTQGIEFVNGRPRGSGGFNIELWLLHQGFDLSGNPHALNETIRYTYKLLLPFLVLILVSKFAIRIDFVWLAALGVLGDVWMIVSIGA